MFYNVTPSANGNSGIKLSDLDRRILYFNHQGLKNTEIARALNVQGIKLKAVTVGRHLSGMRQYLGDNVKTNHNFTLKKPREEQKWYNIISRLKEEIEAYTVRQGFKPSSRTMFYHLQDLQLIQPKDINQYNKATVHARLGWVDSNGELEYPKLDLDCFSDTSRKTVGVYDDREPEEPTQPGLIPDPDEHINYYISELKQAPEYYDGVGEAGRDGRVGGRWYGQPEYVEVWTEKNDLLPALETILKGKRVRIRSGKGFGSLEFLYECSEQLKNLIDIKGLEPEHIHILYCGDMDPPGVEIDNYYRRRFAQLGIPTIKFERIAVTQEQIRKYRLPLESIKQREGKSKPNTNLNEYKRLYGEKATHLNAFFTEAHLPVFKKILLAAVDKHWDKSIYDEMVEGYNIAAEDPPRMSPEELADTRRVMYEKITEAFSPGWYNDV